MAATAESLKALFDQVDKAKTGSASSSALKAAVTGKLPAADCKTFFEFVEKNGDKAMTFDEFKALFA